MSVPGVILSDSVHRLRAYKDPSQAQRGHGGILCSSGGKGGQDKRGDRNLQQTDGERTRLGRDAQ